MSVVKVGDWARAAEVLGRAARGMHSSIDRALRAEAQGLRTEIVSGLTNQAPGGSPIRELAPSTLAARRLGGFRGTLALIRRADLRNAITVVTRDMSVFVGVPRKTVRGKDLIDIAKENEFGFGPIVIRITERMRRFLAVLLREAGGRREGAEGAGSGSGVVIVHIPARPFLRPAFETWRVGVRKRFLRRIGRDVFGV